MDFELTDDQKQLRDAVRAFARQALNERLEQRDHDGEFPRDEWRKCAEFGLLGLPVPAAYGGQGQDLVTTTDRHGSAGLGLPRQRLGLQPERADVGGADAARALRQRGTEARVAAEAGERRGDRCARHHRAGRGLGRVLAGLARRAQGRAATC
jgi:hypothetical protein